MRLARCLIPFLALVMSACSGQRTTAQEKLPESLPLEARKTKSNEPPAPTREFRAVWVATVGNIDWPSKRGLSSDDQKREVIQILERCEKLNLNAVILQVRTSADALYDSKLEPWSEYLSGKQGTPPSPFYDPLQFWIEESHKRGIELHAWFNPFRGKVGAGRDDRHSSHISKTHPEVVKDYGKHLWLDPGSKHAADHSFNVFMDVVERYDVDGIHIDDYFYPYPERVAPEEKEEDTRTIAFPDEDTYRAYQQGGGKLQLEDWRRDNINRMMKRIYEGIKERKPWVQYGISPFGIPGAGRPAYVKGFNQYDKLYADAELWFREGWCDYFVPQLYWSVGAPQQPYLGLLQWWTANNPKKRHLYPGLFTSRIDWSEKSWHPNEIAGQIMIQRLTPGAGGHVHFSMKALTQNRKGVSDQLKSGVYAEDALVPETKWLGGKAPVKVREVAVQRVAPAVVEKAYPEDYQDKQKDEGSGFRVQGSEKEKKTTTGPFVPLATQPTKVVEKRRKLGGVRVTWKSAERGQAVWQYVVYAKQGDAWTMKVVPSTTFEAIFRDSAEEKSPPTTAVAVSAVDRLGVEGPREVVEVSAR